MGALPLQASPPSRAALLASLAEKGLSLASGDVLAGERALAGAASWSGSRAKALPLGVAALDARLPDAGLPRGAVVELCAPEGLGHATRLALGVCAEAQAQARRALGPSGWCAWIDASHSLYAPGVVLSGVDLERLLVIRPASAVARTAVRVAQSRLFAVIVIDRAGIPGASVVAESTLRERTRDDAIHEPSNRAQPTHATQGRWDLVVRRLALAVEGSDTTVVLLTRPSVPVSRSFHDLFTHRPDQGSRSASRAALPVALRLELSRPSDHELSVLVAKERQGRLGGPYRGALLAHGGRA